MYRRGASIPSCLRAIGPARSASPMLFASVKNTTSNDEKSSARSRPSEHTYTNTYTRWCGWLGGRTCHEKHASGLSSPSGYRTRQDYAMTTITPIVASRNEDLQQFIIAFFEFVEQLEKQQQQQPLSTKTWPSTHPQASCYFNPVSTRSPASTDRGGRQQQPGPALKSTRRPFRQESRHGRKKRGRATPERNSHRRARNRRKYVGRRGVTLFLDSQADSSERQPF